MEIKTRKGETITVDAYYFEHINKVGYAVNDSKPRKAMHRFIIEAPKGMVVDHINGNKLDNRKSNLRICTQSGNTANGPIRSSNSSGFKGVSWDKRSSKWSVDITKDYKHIYGGKFDNLADAAKRYNELAIKFHGQFAKLNVI